MKTIELLQALQWITLVCFCFQCRSPLNKEPRHIVAIKTEPQVQSYPKVDDAFQKIDAEIARLQKEFKLIRADPKNHAWVLKKLQHMVDIDQYVRKAPPLDLPSYSIEERTYAWKELARRMIQIDKENFGDLKALLKQFGWFTIGAWGDQADENAWLLVQHADLDILFQKEILAILATLLSQGETNKQNYAYLVDRVARNEHRLQTYGTQGQCANGAWVPFPMEDPANINIRRASMDMELEEDYIKTVDNICKFLP